MKKLKMKHLKIENLFTKHNKMNIIVIKLVEKHIDLPFDIVLYINEFVKYIKLCDENIHTATKLWNIDDKLCFFHYGHISDWDVSHVTIMSGIFHNSKNFNEDISKWNVSNVVDMDCMFNNAILFNGDISKWCVDNVINMCGMFHGAKNFNSDISQWNVLHVTDMTRMFKNALSFNSDISQWNVSNVKYMDFMFYNAKNFNENIYSWKFNNYASRENMTKIKDMTKNNKKRQTAQKQFKGGAIDKHWTDII